ncbi:metallophosphoesterase [Rhizobium puerariae]|uniref:Metallophosphoesterase n=1 Tax=Rhizobium puerariae TaxID=1585791 RepID=A0ABV6AFV2_9HYPH
MQIAIVADVHLHDLHGGYGTVEGKAGGLSLRTLADTMASTRVFNESHAAFLAILDDIVRRGIRDVILLGDYSDDGQLGAVGALRTILDTWRERHGLRFFATFGNHDCFGPEPRHHSKWLTDASGRAARLVTSDEAGGEAGGEKYPSVVVSPGMRGMSTAEAMTAMADCGLRPPADALHWETPFGNSDRPPRNAYRGGDPSSPDASYLVEPLPDLWLLMLDANVFQREGSSWSLRADGAWDHVLAERPYLLDWITEVSCRRRPFRHQLCRLPACSSAAPHRDEACRKTGRRKSPNAWTFRWSGCSARTRDWLQPCGDGRALRPCYFGRWSKTTIFCAPEADAWGDGMPKNRIGFYGDLERAFAAGGRPVADAAHEQFLALFFALTGPFPEEAASAGDRRPMSGRGGGCNLTLPSFHGRAFRPA